MDKNFDFFSNKLNSYNQFYTNKKNFNSKDDDIIENYIQKYINKNIEDEDLSSAVYSINEEDFYSDLKAFAEKTPQTDRISLYNDYRRMEQVGYIGRALTIYTASILQKDYYNKILHINTNKIDIENVLNDFFDRIELENKLWTIVYNTLRDGDCFVKIILNNNYNPQYIKKIEIIDNPAEVTKIFDENNYDYDEKKLIGYLYKNKFYYPYQIIHFKVGSKDYGVSILEPSRLAYKYYKLLKDFIVIYRLERGVEKSVINVPVGNMSKTKIEKYMQSIKEAFRKRNFIDQQGNINTTLNPSSFFERYYIPVRENSQAVTISQIPAGQAIQTLDDFKALRDEMILGLSIPNAYMGIEGGGELARASLAQLDINFARLCEIRQNEILKSIYKLCYLELIFNKLITRDNYNMFKIEFTSVSDLNEKNEIENIQAKINIFNQFLGTNLFPVEWLFKKYLKLSQKDLIEIELLNKKNLTNNTQEQQNLNSGGLTGLEGLSGTSNLSPEGTNLAQNTTNAPEELQLNSENIPTEEKGETLNVMPTGNETLTASKNYNFTNPYLRILYENDEFNGLTEKLYN